MRIAPLVAVFAVQNLARREVALFKGFDVSRRVSVEGVRVFSLEFRVKGSGPFQVHGIQNGAQGPASPVPRSKETPLPP